MSGGFFRGTSAEQDTRFSNKQAKLLKTQKFPPELDHLVDIAKVKMDVIKPWISKRVTELLGFEDEVLINFINGLLEGKNINGKQIQIQLTGFMEKHTGKFMKELWSLLLSAQNNASGVPQQFLDAKEEETRKKKEELDRIGNEMQKRKEKEAEPVNLKMDGGVNDYSTAGPKFKYAPAKDSKVHSDDDKEPDVKNGFRRSSRSSRSPQPANRHPSPHRATSGPASKSYSNSRSYSGERNRSRYLSRSPLSRRYSISPERRFHSPQRSARRTSDESLSPRRSSPFKRRSTSRSRNRSVSPARRKVRSPVHRRLPSPGRRRSRSPLWRRSRSPRRRRSPSPWRRRSPSPVRRRSPFRRRRPSPSPRRRPSASPRRRRSPPPSRRRSRSPRPRRSPSPWRRRSISPRCHISSSPVRRYRRRSPSSSASPVRHRPSSPRRNGSPRSRRRSPSLSSQKSPPPKRRSHPPLRGRSPSPSRRKSLSPLKRSSSSPSRARSLSPVSESSSPIRKRLPVSTNMRSRNQQDRSSSPQSPASLSPVRHSSSSPSGENLVTLKKDLLQSTTDRSRIYDRRSPRYHHTLKERYATPDVLQKGPDSARDMTSISLHFKDQNLSEKREEKAYKRRSSQRSVCSPRKENMGTLENSSSKRHDDDIKLRKKEKDIRREKMLTKEAISLRNLTDDITSPLEKPAVLSPVHEWKEDEESLKLMQKDNMNSPALESTGSEGSGKHRTTVIKKRKHRKSIRPEIESESSGEDSEIEDRKEAKRRKKEEKKLRKDEKRRRREERRRRKEEKRAHKRRSKDSDTMSSNSDKHEYDVNASGGDCVAGNETYSPGNEETESEKKRLENELREKALQNIRAKKGISR